MKLYNSTEKYLIREVTMLNASISGLYGPQIHIYYKTAHYSAYSSSFHVSTKLTAWK